MAEAGEVGERPAVDPAAGAGSSALFDAWLTMHLVRRVLDDALAPAGLSGDDFAFYHLVAGGTLMPTDVVRWTGMRRSIVSSYVRRMTQRGHAERVARADDARSYRIALTAAGRAAYDGALAAFLPLLADLVAGLGGEDDIVTALGRLDAGLRRLGGLPGRPGH